jgi:putative Mn2+ efflux pump MntP
LALVAVSTASSLDALAAGLSLAMLHVGSLPASPVIGLPPAVEAWLAFFLERVT